MLFESYYFQYLYINTSIGKNKQEQNDTMANLLSFFHKFPSSIFSKTKARTKNLYIEYFYSFSFIFSRLFHFYYYLRLALSIIIGLLFYFYLIYENQRSFYLWDDFCNFNYRTSLDWSLPVRTAHR